MESAGFDIAALSAPLRALPVFALVAGRLAGLLMFQPVLGALSIPGRVRALLVIGLALVVSPVVAPPPDPPETPEGLAIGIGIEMLVGAVVGLAVRMCFAALQLAGLLVAQESGLAFAQIVDPTYGEQESSLGAGYVQLGVVAYLVVGGHRQLVSAFLDSFGGLPLLGAGDIATSGAELIVSGLIGGFELAVRLAAPVLLTLMLVNLTLGFLSRTIPQINVITAGFAAKGALAFGITAFTLPSMVDAFANELEDVLGLVREFLRVG